MLRDFQLDTKPNPYTLIGYLNVSHLLLVLHVSVVQVRGTSGLILQSRLQISMPWFSKGSQSPRRRSRTHESSWDKWQGMRITWHINAGSERVKQRVARATCAECIWILSNATTWYFGGHYIKSGKPESFHTFHRYNLSSTCKASCEGPCWALFRRQQTAMEWNCRFTAQIDDLWECGQFWCT